MKIYKALVIAPYEGLKELMLEKSRQINALDVTVFVGDLDKGLDIVKANIDKGYDVIISRGGTSELIRNSINIPVIEINISVYDVLRAIKLVENYASQYAVVGFPSITKCAKILCDLLQYEINIITVQDEASAFNCLTQLKADGYDIVLCDMIGTTVARRLNMNAILITSGSESVEEAYLDAVKMCNSLTKLQEQRDLFQSIVQAFDGETLIYDKEDRLIYGDHSIKRLGSSVEKIIRKSLSDFRKPEEHSIVKKTARHIVHISGKSLAVGLEEYTVLRIIKKSYHAITENNAVRIINKEDNDSLFLNSYYSTSNAFGNIRKAIDKFSQSNEPVLITGETGTGKDKAASMIYENSRFCDNPCYIIDCGRLTDKHWDMLINKADSPLSSNAFTLYFKNIGQISKGVFHRFSEYIDHTNLAKRNRLLFSIIIDNHDDPNNDIVLFLKNNLSCLELFLPPLRERKDDIPSLASLYINELNVSLGKPIIGFDTDAMALLLEYTWERNLDQFKKVLHELVILTDTSYISKEDTQGCLNKERAGYRLPSGIATGIALNQSLEDITYDVIQMVMQDENMNQLKTAKRLGISRSTLWRILKNHK